MASNDTVKPFAWKNSMNFYFSPSLYNIAWKFFLHKIFLASNELKLGRGTRVDRDTVS